MTRRSVDEALVGSLLRLVADSNPANDNESRPIIRPRLAPMSPVPTIPPNGEVNPYGVNLVPPGAAIKTDDFLVLNINDSSSLQGTDATIAPRIPTGRHSFVSWKTRDRGHERTRCAEPRPRAQPGGINSQRDEDLWV